MNIPSKKVRVPDLALLKELGERIVMLTAYDATMARLFDRAGVDLLLVGDSLGNVILGLETTIPVTLEAIIHHTRAVTRGASRAPLPSPRALPREWPVSSCQAISERRKTKWSRR